MSLLWILLAVLVVLALFGGLGMRGGGVGRRGDGVAATDGTRGGFGFGGGLLGLVVVVALVVLLVSLLT